MPRTMIGCSTRQALLLLALALHFVWTRVHLIAIQIAIQIRCMPLQVTEHGHMHRETVAMWHNEQSLPLLEHGQASILRCKCADCVAA